MPVYVFVFTMYIIGKKVYCYHYYKLKTLKLISKWRKGHFFLIKISQNLKQTKTSSQRSTLRKCY